MNIHVFFVHYSPSNSDWSIFRKWMSLSFFVWFSLLPLAVGVVCFYSYWAIVFWEENRITLFLQTQFIDTSGRSSALCQIPTIASHLHDNPCRPFECVLKRIVRLFLFIHPYPRPFWILFRSSSSSSAFSIPQHICSCNFDCTFVLSLVYISFRICKNVPRYWWRQVHQGVAQPQAP